MGNSESSLSPYRYQFEDPKVGDYDLSGTKVFKIDDKKSAEAAEEFLWSAKVLYVDCEGHYFGNSQQKLGTVQVATGSDCCLVFHITKYHQSLDLLKILFESDEVQKVFHDCSGDSAVLFHEHGIRLSSVSVDDTQIAYKVLQSRLTKKPIDPKTGPSLDFLYMNYFGKRIPGKKHFNKNNRTTRGGNIWIDNSELFDGMVKYAAVDALAVCEIFAQQEGLFKKDSEYKELIEKQLRKKIKNHNSAQQEHRVDNSGSFNWGLFAGGAAVTLALGAAAVSVLNTDKNEKKMSGQKSTDSENTDKQKKDECIIS